MRTNTTARLAFALVTLASASAGLGQTFVSGTINWTDGAGLLHPARRVWVEVWTTNAVGGDSMQARFQTDRQGQYAQNIGLPSPLHTGSYLKVFAENDAATVGTENNPPNHYILTTPAAGRLGLGDNFLSLNIPATNDAEKSMSVLDSMLTGYDFAKDVRGGVAPGKVNVKFHDGAGTAFYAGTTRIGAVRGDAFDWDPLIHEYGHFATFGDNVAVSQPGGHSSGTSSIPALGKQAGARMAYKEGVANWFGVVAQSHKIGVNNVPIGMARVGNTLYEDSDDLTFNYDLERHVGSTAAYTRTQGEGDELAATRILWDLGDKAGDRGFVNEAYDRVGRGQTQVYADLTGAAAAQADGKLKNLSQVFDYYANLQGAGVNAARDRWRTDVGAIFEAHDVSPSPQGVIGQTYDAAGVPITFDWRAKNNNANETFQLIIWSSDFATRIVQTANITDRTDYQLSNAEWTALTAAFAALGVHSAEFKFAVLGGDRKDAGGTAYAGESLTTMYWSDAYTFTMVPTPGALALGGLGGLVLCLRRRRA